MGAIQDEMALQDQEKIDKQAAAQNAKTYNPDGSAKANDYHAPTLSQSKFPSDLKVGSELRVNPDQLAKVASQMGNDLASLRATLQTLGNGGGGGGTVGGWDTADAFGNNAGQAFYGIYSFYTNLNSVYDEVIGLLHSTVGNYSDAEETNTASANSINANVAPGGLA